MTLAMSGVVPVGRTTRPLSASALTIFWVYLGMVAAAELITSLVNPAVGLGAHLVVMAVLLVHSALGHSDQERKFALALTLAPMIRLLSLAMPLINFPQIDWYPIVSIPLLTATWIIVRQAGITRTTMGLRKGDLGLQLMLLGMGLGLGVLEYSILRPKPIIASLDPLTVLFACLSLVIFTGFNEELIFRGLLQGTSLGVLGGKGLVYVALLFGALHIGYLSILDVMFVTAVGLLFGYIARWGGSILGVTLAHGLTNITLFIIMPVLMRDWPKGALITAVWFAGAGALLSVPAIALLWWRSRPVRELAEVSHKTNETAPEVSQSLFITRPLDLPEE